MCLTAAAWPRGDGKPAHSANRWQRFAAEPEESDVDQVIIGKLRGGVALNREGQVIRAHADAVIRDADQALATAPESDVDLGGARIDGILDEFLHDAGRAFDHLARRDAVHCSF